MVYTAPIDEKELVKQLQNKATASQAFDALIKKYSQ